MNIYMYTVYTYLSVDIYECMSNVSVTCRYRQYISCYICICSPHPFCSTFDHMDIDISDIMCMYDVSCVIVILSYYHNCAKVAHDGQVLSTCSW